MVLSGQTAPLCRSCQALQGRPLLTGRPSVPGSRALYNRGQLQIQNAISRAKKEATVAKLVHHLETSALCFGVRYKYIGVKDVDSLRQALPEGSAFVVCKNTLMRIASDQAGAAGWDVLKPATEGENAWLFIDEDNVSKAVKAFLEFEKKLVERIPKDQRSKRPPPTAVSGGAMITAGEAGRFLDMAGVRALKDAPTKTDLMLKLAIMIKKIPRSLAVSIKLVPTKLGWAIAALADGDENKDLLVGDVFPKEKAASETAA
ncbi:hypothetical protein WJX84_004083 [Apatococcus fuscideae]|uniref:Uncharacterized protein n=1 Tax=Apatococcus fuscideae TaxID=2026836 RepID=A0AAW1RJV7_9CHLO